MKHIIIRSLATLIGMVILSACGGGGGGDGGGSMEVPTLASSSGMITENAVAGDSVGSLTITSTGGNPITATTLSGAGSSNFTVGTSGDITVAAGATLDYEVASIYNLTAVATNAVGTSSAAPVVIHIQDYAQPFLIAELKADSEAEVYPGRSSVAIGENGEYIVVGNPSCDETAHNAGCVYVYKRQSDNSVIRIAKLQATPAGSDDHFGYSVAMHGEYIVVGAPNDDTSAANAGSVYLFKRNSDTDIAQITKIQADTVHGSERFGSSTAMDGDLIIIGANDNNSHGAHTGAAYLFKHISDAIDGTQQIAMIQAEAPAEKDYFGYSVAISGDHFVVGAPSSVETGYATLFRYNPTDDSITRIVKMQESSARRRNDFGRSVTMNGDYIVVGAPKMGNGKAYLFKRTSATSVVQLQEFHSHLTRMGDKFGSSVAIDRDYIVIGAPYAGSFGGGRAYFFRKNSDSNVTEEQLLSFADGRPHEYGCSIAVQGNLAVVGNGLVGDDKAAAFLFDMEPIDRPYIYNMPLDPIQYKEDFFNKEVRTIRAKSPSTDTVNLTIGGTDEAWFEFDDKKLYFDPQVNYEVKHDDDHHNDYELAVIATDSNGHSVSRDITVEVQDTYFFDLPEIFADDVGSDHYFGQAVAVSGDYIVVGAYLHDKAYLFKKEDNGTITHLATFSGDDTGSGDLFGISVAIDGDYIAIGASLANNAGQDDSGAVYLFKRYPGTPDIVYQRAKIKSDTPRTGDEFGRSVAINGNYVSIGAPKDDTQATNAGSLYLYYNSGSAVSQKAKVFASDAHASDRFGFSVSMDYPYVVAGAYVNSTGTGGAYVFKYNTTTGLNQIDRLVASDGSNYDHFGYDVSISGSYIAVGASGDDDGVSNSGSAYVFKLDSDAVNDYTQLAKLHASDQHANDAFGTSVAISENHIIVGSPFETTKYSKAGAVYVYKRQSDLLDDVSQVAKIRARYEALDNYFGTSVSIDDGLVAVGTPGGKIRGNNNSGIAYIFMKDADQP